MSIKLLICDDEKIIREGLSSLEWQQHDVEVIGTAKNGIEALEIISKIPPDIIISDVRMPQKDGIWLAEQVHNNYPDIQMIFLTGYNEFEYAQMAINYNVSKYLMKPIDEDELYEAVDQIIKNIQISRQSIQKADELKNLLERSKYFLMEYLFSRIKYNTIDTELFGLSQPPQTLAAVVVKLEDINPDGVNFAIFESLLSNKSDKYEIIPFFGDNNLTFIFCLHCSVEKAESIIFSACESFSDTLDDKYNCNYNIGIGTIISAIPELKDSYKSAIRALSYSPKLGNKNIIYIQDVEPNSRISNYTSKLFDVYIKALKTNDTYQIKKTINEIFDSMQRASATLYNCQRNCLSLLLAISDALYDLDCNPAILFNNTDAWSLIKKSLSTDELKSFISNITDVVIAHIDEMQKQKTQNIINHVKELVEQNYSSDASLETIASQVYISPCYLSVIFKKETNITFKNYLINTRIEKAKAFLENSDLKIYEIAEKVGYTDTRYFSELFQRVTGKTPSQYRAKNK